MQACLEAELGPERSPRKVDLRLPGKGDSNSHGARPVHQKHRWIRTSRLPIKNSLSLTPAAGREAVGSLSAIDTRSARALPKPRTRNLARGGGLGRRALHLGCLISRVGCGVWGLGFGGWGWGVRVSDHFYQHDRQQRDCDHVIRLCWSNQVGGGVRFHPKNARMSGRHGVQYVAQCVACAALTLVVRQWITNLSWSPQ